MKNITITLDDDTAHRARVRAAEHNVSLSRHIVERVRKDVRDAQQRLRDERKIKRDYEKAMLNYLSRGPFKQLTGLPQKYAAREELHDRAALRRK
jgi:hypothetical protein